MKKPVIIGVVVLLIALFSVALFPTKTEAPEPIPHPEPVVVDDSAPVPPESDLIRLDSPQPNQVIKSPLVITGTARGTWFFEASFPITLTDWDGRIIAEGYAEAQSDWMTTEFVPFKAVITFTVDKNVYSNRGSLILKKDNPSGLPQYDAYLEIPIQYSTSTADMKNPTPQPVACTMDAKICPDGSAVGRSGPKCEFTPCPVTQSLGNIFGVVTLSPTCPVERNPPDPNCAPQPHPTSIAITKPGSAIIVKTISTNQNGAFSVYLEAGKYVLRAKGGQTFPSCGEVSADVKAGQNIKIDISCDSGIR